MTTVKIYGPKRSGTNLLTWILRQMGHKVMVHEGSWKHGPPVEIQGPHKYICITKNPFNWMASIRRYKEPKGEPPCGLREWINLTSGYIRQQRKDPDRWKLVLFEDLISDPDRVIHELQRFTGGTRRPNKLPEKRMDFHAHPIGGKMDISEFQDGRMQNLVTEQEHDTILAEVGDLIELWNHRPELWKRDGDASPVVDIASFHSGVGDCLVALRVQKGLQEAGVHCNLYLRHNFHFSRLFSNNTCVAPEDFKPRPLPYGAIRIDREVQGCHVDYTQDAWDKMMCGLPIKVFKMVRDKGPVIAPPIAELPPANTPDNAIVIFPYAAWREREVPTSTWREVASKLTALGETVVVMGPKGREQCASSWEISANLCGAEWGQVISNLKTARCVVTCDSGPLHMAGQLDLPAVAVHAMFRPEVLTDRYPNTTSLFPEEEECSGCNRSGPYNPAECGAEPPHWSPRHQATGCPVLRRITSDKIVDAIREKIKLT